VLVLLPLGATPGRPTVHGFVPTLIAFFCLNTLARLVGLAGVATPLALRIVIAVVVVLIAIACHVELISRSILATRK
jgi:hypothetical protein